MWSTQSRHVPRHTKIKYVYNSFTLYQFWEPVKKRHINWPKSQTKGSKTGKWERCHIIWQMSYRLTDVRSSDRCKVKSNILEDGWFLFFLRQIGWVFFRNKRWEKNIMEKCIYHYRKTSYWARLRFCKIVCTTTKPNHGGKAP